MENNSARLRELFKLYLDNRLTGTQYTEFWSLLNNESGENALDEDLKELWRNSGIEDVPISSEEWDYKMKMLRNIVDEKEDKDLPVVKSIPFLSRFKWVAAAIVLMLSTAGWLWFNNTAGKAEKEIAKTTPPFEEVATYIRNITLPDGSMVVLHAGSKLDYVSDFNKSKLREVTLTGEAYFDIRHDASKPFVIYTGSVKTTVLGTAFNIKAYEGSPEVIVSVTRGKVKVEDKKKVIAVLTPDQQVTYNKNVANVVQQNINAEHVVTNWTKEDMNFKALPLETIVQLLNTRYSIPISLSNHASKKCLVTASFSGTESLQDVIAAICTILGDSFEIKDNGEIIINGKECEPSSQ